ncbi:hypothetical protein DY000_02052078 [Brassica cretica]|uniref:Uncharacterized protein n=1 Tax=Brassica cretica TaxID=69181 RepID=A0ABQ7AI29_BRACR|nr:hypothetical protein DY000_02052078 [Brassica cretica]
MKFALTKERNPQSKIEKENRSRTRPGETLIETEPEELRWKADKGGEKIATSQRRKPATTENHCFLETTICSID